MPANITTAKNLAKNFRIITKETGSHGVSVKDNNIAFDAGAIIIKCYYFIFEFLQKTSDRSYHHKLL
jgi:hypothetical protein